MKIKSNRKKRFAIFRLSAIIFALLSLIGLYIGGTKQTYADSVSLSESDITTYTANILAKVMYNNLKKCYSGAITSAPIAEDTTNFANLIVDKTVELYFPNILDAVSSITCTSMLKDKEFKDYKENGGFKSDQQTDKKRGTCFRIRANLNDVDVTGTYRTGDYCVDIDSAGNVTAITGPQQSDSMRIDGGLAVGQDGKVSFTLKQIDIDTNGGEKTYYATTPSVDNCQQLGYKECRATAFEYEGIIGEKPLKYEDLKESLKKVIDNATDDTGKKILMNVELSNIGANTIISTTYEKEGTNEGADKFANVYFSKTGKTNVNVAKNDFTAAEKYIIYWDYLKNYYKSKPEFCSDGSQGITWLNEKYVFQDNVCIYPQKNVNEVSYVPFDQTKNDGIHYYWNARTMSASEMIGEMSNINVAEAFKDKPTSIIIDDGENGGSESSEDYCSGASGSLGWILCPIIYTARNAINGVYEKLENWLQINSNIVTKLGSTDAADNGLFKAWTTFRNIANIAFVILFMIIIFSQLTGYGIDNYGIKRMLPKLIVTAILVNLSYVICGLLVDISNIVGNSVKGLFESMAVDTSVVGSNSTQAVPNIINRISGIGITAAAALAFVAAAWAAGPLPILLFFIAIAIGAFTILIILGMRQALVVALIVASPLALVCMILPNTEGIYKKWLNAFKGLLIVYPIIGAVIGAGYFAASVLIQVNTNSDGELVPDAISMIISGILMIAPYFMIPSLTRKSLDAIGSIGSRISSFGQRGSGRAQNGVRNSNFGKSMQQNHEYKQAKRYMEGGILRKKFKKDSRGKQLADKINAGKKVSIRSANKYQQMANLASAREQANIGARTAQSKYSRLQNTGYDASLSAAASAEEDAAIKDYETQIRNGDFKAAFMKEVREGGKIKRDKNGNIVKELITDRAPEGDNELAAALEYELKLGQAADKNKIIALQNILSKTDGGRNAMVESINSALQERDGDGNRIVSSTSVKALASNIMANQGDYKGVHRSIYEWAKDVLNDKNREGNTTKVNMGSITGIDRTGGIQALTPSSFLSTDKTQMEQYLKFYESGNAKIKAIREQVKNGTLGEEEANKQIEAIKSDPDRIRLEEAAHSIAYNPNLHGSIRWDDYRAALETFASDIDWSSVRSGRGVEVQISHDNETQSVSVQTQQTSQPEPTQAQPQPAPQQVSQPQQQQKTDYAERLKEEIIQRNMNGEISDDTMIELLKMVNGSNNQKPNNS